MIGVEISNHLIKMTREGLHSRYVLRSDVVDWLHDHVGAGDHRVGWSPGCDWMWSHQSDNAQKAVVVFSDPKVATLFKLTWHGVDHHE